MEEMSRALKSITHQMSRLKSDPNVPALPPPRNSMGYRRPNNPQILQRDRRNDDQNMQTPVRKDINNLEQEDEYIEELIPVVEEEPEDEDQEFYLDEGSPEIHLAQEEGESSKDTLPNLEHEKFGVSETQYQDISDNLLGEVQKKYELRSRTIKVPETNPNPTKKIPAKKTTEKETKNNNKDVEKAADKNLDKRNIPSTSAPNVVVENPTAKQPGLITPEQGKAQANFNLENELAKIKIAIPLSELAVNPAYKPKVEEWMATSKYDKQPGSVNFEEERPKVVFGPHVE